MLLVLSEGCGKSVQTKPVVFRVAIDMWPGYYPLVIAQELGYMKEEGVELAVTVSPDTRLTLADYAAGRYELICVSLGDVVLLRRSRSGTRVLLFCDESEGGDQLIARRPLGVGESLRGKRIGVSLGGFGEVFVKRYLSLQGLSLAEVQLVNVDASIVPEMLAQGEIDLGHTWEPYAGRARRAGDQVLFSSKETPGLILDCTVVDEALLRERGKELRGVQHAWCRAVEWWQLHREEGSRMLEEKLKLPSGSCRLVGLKLLGREENLRLLRTGEGSMELSVDEHVEHFVKSGMVVRRVRTTDLIEPGFFQ